MGPFCPEQGTSSHDIVIDLASTDEITILLTDEVGAIYIYIWEHYNNEYKNVLFIAYQMRV